MLFPDECRVCDAPLTNLSRIPVCASCLESPRPLAAEHACRICQTPFTDEFPLDEYDQCTVCRGREVNFDAAFSFGSYEGTLRDLIRLFKYSKIETLAKPLSGFLAQAMPRDIPVDLVAAMPMHWYRRWQRGFNQAELLAQPVARRYGLQVSPLLRRVRMGKRQAGLGATARYKNLQGAFQLGRRARVEGKRILLIDDVLTTGSTLVAATAVLKAAGAKHVTVLTVARVLRRSGMALPVKPPIHSAKERHSAKASDSAKAGDEEFN